MSDEANDWGGPAQMSAWEALMWRAETDRRTRSTGMLLETLDSEPDWHRFREAVARTAQRIPRLRDRVVEPSIPVVQPVWSPYAAFDVADHVRRVPISAPGTHRQLLEQCEVEWDRVMDRSKPPWEVILFTGLEDGKAAMGFRCHHSLSDGMGLIQLLRLAHVSGGRTAPAAQHPRRGFTTGGLMVDAARSALNPANALKLTRTGVGTAVHTAANPIESIGSASRYVRSLTRMLQNPEGDVSAVLSTRSSGHRLSTLDIPLHELKAASAAVGGSVNDAFVAAILGGVRRYHELVGEVASERVVVAMPVSLRRENDPLGGNRFAGIRFAAPGAEHDPAVRIHTVREHVLRAREEPAIGFLDQLSPALTRLPTPLIIELSANLTASSDVQISNIRGLTESVSLAGAQVTRTYPLGPRPGVAMMVAMITYGDVCCLGINVDPQCFPDADTFEKALTEGFDEVLALTAEDSR
ncbi:wax ester/triacylglycerol synthase domain-containing protein [Gordonia rhizosphera]|uniref:wax ester/triacylglycerol synthase domain-containing protein n=1 Tax=Gordonia rhizosphera TaxID=83341 RepID=UPI0014613E45|nr:wax ester/triacylglycerol synthase domain-containing protein [Gordonia rhizosphera]